MGDNGTVNIRQQPRRVLRLNADDQEHGGTNGDQLRVRNTIAHPPVPPTPAVVDRSGGAMARCGGATHGNDDKAI